MPTPSAPPKGAHRGAGSPERRGPRRASASSRPPARCRRRGPDSPPLPDHQWLVAGSGDPARDALDPTTTAEISRAPGMTTGATRGANLGRAGGLRPVRVHPRGFRAQAGEESGPPLERLVRLVRRCQRIIPRRRRSAVGAAQSMPRPPCPNRTKRPDRRRADAGAAPGAFDQTPAPRRSSVTDRQSSPPPLGINAASEGADEGHSHDAPGSSHELHDRHTPLSRVVHAPLACAAYGRPIRLGPADSLRPLRAKWGIGVMHMPGPQDATGGAAAVRTRRPVHSRTAPAQSAGPVKLGTMPRGVRRQNALHGHPPPAAHSGRKEGAK